MDTGYNIFVFVSSSVDEVEVNFNRMIESIFEEIYGIRKWSYINNMKF